MDRRGAGPEYEADNLFDYMNGNAEGYLIYGFSRMDGVTCRKGDDTVVIDVSSMGEFENAFGMFMANRDTKSPIEPIGMAGQVHPRRAVFCKGRFYVELAANPDKDHTAALRAFVTAIEAKVEGRSSPGHPEVVPTRRAAAGFGCESCRRASWASAFWPVAGWACTGLRAGVRRPSTLRRGCCRHSRRS